MNHVIVQVNVLKSFIKLCSLPRSQETWQFYYKLRLYKEISIIYKYNNINFSQKTCHQISKIVLNCLNDFIGAIFIYSLWIQCWVTYGWLFVNVNNNHCFIYIPRFTSADGLDLCVDSQLGETGYCSVFCLIAPASFTSISRFTWLENWTNKCRIIIRTSVKYKLHRPAPERACWSTSDTVTFPVGCWLALASFLLERQEKTHTQRNQKTNMTLISYRETVSAER